MNKIRQKIVSKVVLTSALALSLFSSQVYCQQGRPLVYGNCSVVGSDEAAQRNSQLLSNLWYNPADFTVVYCPECGSLNNPNTANAFDWQDNFTRLPQGDGNTELRGSSCQVVSAPTSPDNTMLANGVLPSNVSCDFRLNATYFTEECVDFDKTALPWELILAIGLGSAAFIFLILGIVCVVLVKKRTRRIEQEKADKTAKVIVLDAPAPAPLYGADDGEYQGMIAHDFDDEYTKHLRAMKSRGSIKASPYADPNMKDSDQDLEEGMTAGSAYGAAAWPYGDTGKRKPSNVAYSRTDMARYGVPGATDDGDEVGYGEKKRHTAPAGYGAYSGYGAGSEVGYGEKAPARRQYGSYGQGALARPDVSRHDVSYVPKSSRRNTVPSTPTPATPSSASHNPARRKLSTQGSGFSDLSRPDVNRHEPKSGRPPAPFSSQPTPQVPWITAGAAAAGGAEAGSALARANTTSQIHRSGSKRITREDSWIEEEKKKELKRRENERIDKERERRDREDRRASAPDPDREDDQQLGTSKSLRDLQKRQLQRAKSEENFHNPYTYGYGTGTSQGDQSYQTGGDKSYRTSQDYPRSEMVF